MEPQKVKEIAQGLLAQRRGDGCGGQKFKFKLTGLHLNPYSMALITAIVTVFWMTIVAS